MLLTLLAVILAGIGARDQATVASLTEVQGARPGLLIVAIASCILSAGIAAGAAVAVAPMLVPKARMYLAAMALAAAGIESLLFATRRKPEEPTRSLGAFAIVIFAHQLTDAARFLVFAIAVATFAPVSAGIGGAAGGVAVLTAAWLAPELFTAPALGLVRRAIGAVLLVIAAVTAF